MKYIVEKRGNDVYILQQEEDGTYRKIANGHDIEAAVSLVRDANFDKRERLLSGSYEEVHG